MIVINEEAIEGKHTNQLDENYNVTGVWLVFTGFDTFEEGVLNGWQFSQILECIWFVFYEGGDQKNHLYIDQKTSKIAQKTITI